MELLLYHSYTRNAVIAYFGGTDTAEAFCDGEFVVLPQVTLCFFTVRTGSAPSHFTAPSSFTWRPQGQPNVEDHSFPWLPPPVRTRHRQSVFVRTEAGSQEYFYVGKADLGSYGRAGQDVRACYSLLKRLPRHAWLAVGGALVPPDPFAHLRTPSAPIAPLDYHQQVFDLLHLPPQVSEHTVQRLQELERRHALSLPAAVREWYGLTGAMDIMRAISLMHHPAHIPDELLDPAVEQTRHALLQAYQATPPHLPMLPLMYENQWCWNSAFPVGRGDNPQVYLGERRDPPGKHYQFDWLPHTERFSDFVWAWAWEYVTYERDYMISLPVSTGQAQAQETPYLTLEDIAEITQRFSPAL